MDRTIKPSTTVPWSIWSWQLNEFSLYLSVYSSFRMTVESNHSFAIALLSDWLKSFAPVLQPTRSKTKIIAPFAPVVIGQLSLRYWFFDSYLKASLLADFKYNSKTIFFVGLKRQWNPVLTSKAFYSWLIYALCKDYDCVRRISTPVPQMGNRGLLWITCKHFFSFLFRPIDNR